MSWVMNRAAAVDAVLQGGRIVTLTARQREVARIPDGCELVAEKGEDVARLVKLIEIRAEHEVKR